MAIGNPVTLTNNVASKIISATATANQTLFTVTGGYRINAIAVFRNGVRLVDGSDFTALDASTVTLSSPANLNDTLEFHIFDDFRVADAIVSADANQTISGNLTITGTLTGASIGIDSGGVNVGAAKTLNFVGTGNTFLQRGDTIDVSISGGGGGGGLGTAINYADGTTSPFSFFDAHAEVTENLNLDAVVAGGSTSYVVSVIPNISVNSGVAVTVGVGKTMIIDVLQVGDL
tara:strand:+ start:1154 stop:1849 length:696 start_codon:yes stop_codon:yes gene_type:complete